MESFKSLGVNRDAGPGSQKSRKVNMLIHKRLRTVQAARNELAQSIDGIIKQHDLTAIEVERILLTEAMGWNTVALRAERHPENPEKKSDEA